MKVYQLSLEFLGNQKFYFNGFNDDLKLMSEKLTSLKDLHKFDSILMPRKYVTAFRMIYHEAICDDVT